jgi:hypothetical protein
MAIEFILNGEPVRDCEAKLRDFVRYDAYLDYDRDGARAEPRPDMMSEAQLRAVNTAMRARSSTKAWRPFLNTPFPELARIPTAVDLADSAEPEVDAALGLVKAAVQRLCVPWITDMAATKMLHLKRPRLVAISDEYVRRALGIPESPAGAGRAIAVARAIRGVALANADALQALKEHCDALVDPQGDPVRLSKVRILDILIWIESAGRSGHQFWSRSHPASDGVGS